MFMLLVALLDLMILPLKPLITPEAARIWKVPLA
jgi:hypothetical protein